MGLFDRIRLRIARWLCPRGCFVGRRLDWPDGSWSVKALRSGGGWGIVPKWMLEDGDAC